MIIKNIKAKKVDNSKREKTIKIIVKTSNGKYEASAPSGTSKSEKAVMDFPKEGVDYSIRFVNKKLKNDLKNLEINSFEELEKVENIIKKYDNTPKFENVGGNTVIALEFALLKALAKGQVWKFLNPHPKQIPRPVGNCIGGGKHIKKKVGDFQEYLLLSLDARNFDNAINVNYEIYEDIKKELKNKDKSFDYEMTSEGAWAPNLSVDEILDILNNSIHKIETNFKIQVGVDVAAQSFFKGGFYWYRNFSRKEKEKKLSRNDQIKFVIDLVNKYDVCYLEDPLEDYDSKGYEEIRKKIGHKCLVVGDDLIATNPDILKNNLKSINAVIVKPNQIGSLLKVKELISLAKKNNIVCIMSHRSGETTDTIISHLAVGFDCELIKAGIYGKERIVKYNELKKIEKEIKGL